MDNTKAQQKALDDDLVAPANRLKIGKSSLRLSSNLKSKEPTLQVALDALKLTSFYKAFEITADVPEIYIDLGHTGEIKVLSDVNVNQMHQPWRSFVDIINKCLSGKTTTLESLRLSCAQILWVIVDYFMVKDLSIPKRNKMFWHYARDDLMFTTIRVISKHQDTQLYRALLPQHLTNQAMLESEAYKTYHAYATGEKIPKPKYVKNKADPESSPKKKSAPGSEGKRLKTSVKVTKPDKKKKPATTSKAKGLNGLSEVALSEAKQIKLATKRSKTQFHSSHASGSGADEGTGVTPTVPDVPTYNFDDEQISWKSSDEDNDEVNVSEDNDDQDDVDNEDDDDQDDAYNKHDDDQDDADNKDDDERQDEEDKEEEGSDLRVQTPSHYESTDDEESDEVTQGGNVEGEELNEETDEDEEVNELYRDVNVNLEGRDTEMTRFISNMLNPNPDTGIDSILNLNTKSTSLIDVPVFTTIEMPPSSATIIPPPPVTLIQPLQQTPVPTPTIFLSTSLQDLPNFGSLFKFEDRVTSLEDDFSEFKQTNQFIAAVSLIPGIVDTYLANKMNEAIKTTIQLQSDRLRDEAQAKNADFINKLDENIKKIIKKQVKVQVKDQVYNILPKIEKLVNDELEAEVLTRSSNEAKTSHAIAANLSELELKKILIDKMENDQDEDEEPSAGSNWGSKRRRAGKEPESTSAPKEKTSKSSGKSKEGSKSHNTSTRKSAQAEEPIHADEDLEEPAHQEFDIGFTKDQPVDEITQHLDWFQKPTKPPTPDHDWNKTLPTVHGPIQPWISNLAQKEDTRDSFNELMDTPLDFSAFVMNRLKVDTLTPELLAGLTFELMKGSESARDVYFRHRIIAVTKLQIVEWHNYNHLDWITVRRNDDKLYTFKKGDYKRLHLQDIEDMLLLLVQGKLTNLNLGVESYQKKLNLTRPDTYRSDLKRLPTYSAYPNLRGFIYQNKDKKNKLMRIGTLNDVWTALDDILNRIRMKYLP
ncbi:hypothetical protein Tco_0209933 [Tanacetum coccineum]